MRFNTFTFFNRVNESSHQKIESFVFDKKNHFVAGFETPKFLSTFPESFCSLGDIWHQSMPDENGSQHDQPPGSDN